MLAVLTWAAAVDRLAFGHTHGIDPAPTWMVALLWTLVGIGIPLLLARAALVTDVDEPRLRVGFAPFPQRHSTRRYPRVPLAARSTPLQESSIGESRQKLTGTLHMQFKVDGAWQST